MMMMVNVSSIINEIFLLWLDFVALLLPGCHFQRDEREREQEEKENIFLFSLDVTRDDDIWQTLWRLKAELLPRV